MGFPMLGERPLTLRRRSGLVTWDSSGSPVTPSPVDSSITGSVQPLTKDDIKRLPEGYRIDKWRKVFTFTILEPLDQTTESIGDQIVIDGEVYTVNLIDPWGPVAPIPHCEALCVRAKE